MRTTKMPGLLCRSHASIAVCQSHASAAVCIPTDPRATAIRPRRSYEINYSRLGDERSLSTAGDRIRAVTLPMVTKRERATEKAKPSCGNTSVVPSLTTSTHCDQLFQVVVMRVSIHCQGCAGKLRKHISKMEGVTSFSIDLESKRVTVMGHVSPVGVLESISKVKKAEFWTSSCS